jgi:hypothetical protein
MQSTLLSGTILAFSLSLPAIAEEKDCLTGKVTFDTAGVQQVLTLDIHDRKVEVPKGLMDKTDLPAMGGVFSIYPEPRESRTLVNSNALAGDLMTFDATGKALNLLSDETGAALDRMESGEGMLYAAYLAGGTIAAASFDDTTVMTGWSCVTEK